VGLTAALVFLYCVGMRRRELLQSALCALLPSAGSTRCAPPPSEQETRPSVPPLAPPLSSVGLQLYTVRDLLPADPEGTLATIAAIGYREVEFAGYFGLSPSQWKTALDQLGLAAPAAHFHLDVFQNSFEAILDNALVLGHQYLVMPFTPDELRSADGYRQVAAILNNAGQIAAASGVQVVFHNHDFDFDLLPNEAMLGYDILATELDPNLVSFELDTYWIEIAGLSSVDYLQRYPGRYRLCHLKDTGPNRAMEDVGYGTLDWPSIVNAASNAGVVHFIVEHDQPSDAIRSIERSFRYLSGTPG